MSKRSAARQAEVAAAVLKGVSPPKAPPPPAKETPAPKAKPIDATVERLLKAVDADGLRHMEQVDAVLEKADDRRLLTRRFHDDAISRMLRRKQLTYAQWFAADWYRTLYAEAMSAPKVTAAYGEGAGGVGNPSYGYPRSERQATARQTLRDARAVLPIQMVGLIERVIVHDEMPALRNGQQRARFAMTIGAALQPLADWMHAPGHNEA